MRICTNGYLVLPNPPIRIPHFLDFLSCLFEPLSTLSLIFWLTLHGWQELSPFYGVAVNCVLVWQHSRTAVWYMSMPFFVLDIVVNYINDLPNYPIPVICAHRFSRIWNLVYSNIFWNLHVRLRKVTVRKISSIHVLMTSQKWIIAWCLCRIHLYHYLIRLFFPIVEAIRRPHQPFFLILFPTVCFVDRMVIMNQIIAYFCLYLIVWL